MTGGSVREEWELACEAEKIAWAKVEQHLPGDPEFDLVAWEEWLQTLRNAAQTVRHLICDD